MADEDIIRRKLMFDGEGTGDDRRINILQRLIAHWILRNYESQDEMTATYNKILSQISAIEYSRRKSELIRKNYPKELEHMKNVQSEMRSNTDNVKAAIEKSKALLSEVQYSRHYKVNCDMIVKDILAEQSREETSRRVKDLTQNVSSLKESINLLNNEWSKWRRQFNVIVTSANQLRMILNESTDTNES